MASILDLLKSFGVTGKLIPILTRNRAIPTRRGGGLGDPIDVPSAYEDARDTVLGRERGKIDWERTDPNNLIPIPPEDYEFDPSQMIPFVSSNVDGGYYRPYPDPIHGQPTEYGNMFLLFQKRRPEVPGGRPIGPPRPYLYQNCPEFVWDAIFEAGSKGGVVWDIIRRGGAVDGDRIG